MTDIKQQAQNFWTGKSFAACCEDDCCSYNGSLMKDGSYLIDSDSHGYQIRIQRNPTASWEMEISKTPVAKDGWMENTEIEFWDEVARLYQEIPAWLVQPLDEAIQNQAYEQDVQAVAALNFLEEMDDAFGRYLESTGVISPVAGLFDEFCQLPIEESSFGQLDLFSDYTEYTDVDKFVKDIMNKYDSDMLNDPALYLGPAFKKKIPEGIIKKAESPKLVDLGAKKSCHCETSTLLAQGCSCGGI